MTRVVLPLIGGAAEVEIEGLEELGADVVEALQT